jgi:hypothetical protein
LRNIKTLTGGQTMKSVSEILKRFWRFAFRSLILLLILGGNIWLAYTNFAALKVSFAYGGYDTTPLGKETLTGNYWEAFGLYNLTVADMYAAAMAFFVALLSAVACHHLYRTIRLLIERREYRKTGQTAMVADADSAIIREITDLCYALVPLFPLAAWDMQLYRFRTVVTLLNMDNNPLAVKDWPFILQQYGNLFAVRLIRPWAYIGLIVGAGLLLDYYKQRVGEAYESLVAGFESWYAYITGAEVDEATEPLVAQTPQTEQAADTAPGSESSTAADMEAHRTSNGNNSATDEHQETNIGTAGPGGENVEWPDREEVKPNYTSTAGDVHDNEEDVPVYGGRPGEKVKFSVAAANPENYFIDERRRVWRRTFSFDDNEGEPASAAA